MIFVFILILGIVIIVAASRHQKTVGSSWQEAAKKLGLRFEGGGMFHRLSMSGRHGGYHVDVSTFSRGSGKGSRKYTGYRVVWPKSLNLGLNLSRQGIFSGVSSLLGRQDLIVGDPAFDAVVVVKATDVDGVRDFLDRQRRTQILRLHEHFSEYEIDDRSIFCCKPGVESDATRLIRRVQNIVNLAWTLTADPEKNEIITPAVPPPIPRSVEIVEAEPAETSEEPAVVAVVATPAPAVEPAAHVFEPADPDLPPARREPAEDEQDNDASPAKQNDALSESALDLFDRGRNRYEIGRHFDTYLKGREICGAGRLRRVTAYSNDREFGRGPGAIAEVDICDPADPLPGIGHISGLVQLPEEIDLRILRERIGSEATVCGTLTRCDAFTGKLYLSRGEVAV